MLDRIVAFLERRPDADQSGSDPFSVKQVAAAALMVEGARLDKDFDASERAAMERIVGERFELNADDASTLIDIAYARQSANYDNWQFANAVKKNFSPEEQIDILSMMWEVAYADGELHRFEVHQIKSVASQLGLSDADLEKARKDAQARLGITD
ncbi:TerB family tellurite resistance protein [Pyruvatibacter sp.]|uniref:tellurite resistance TerB family protein n=1 Tax=Pyruvatibacter sp. TaxID=1981328 RepID=UPI0032EBB9A8